MRPDASSTGSRNARDEGDRLEGRDEGVVALEEDDNGGDDDADPGAVRLEGTVERSRVSAGGQRESERRTKD